MKSQKSFYAIFVLLNLNYALAQHGVSRAWGDSVALPKANGSSASARTGVGNTMVVDKQGKVYLFYKEQMGNKNDIYFTTSANGVIWTTPELFMPAQSTSAVGNFNLAIDAADNIHLAWAANQQRALYYSRFEAASRQWSSPTSIADAITYEVGYVNITVDRKMRVHVFWHDGDDVSTGEVIYKRSPDNGASWEQQQNFSSSPAQASVFPRADFSGNNSDTVAVAWRENVGGASTWDVMMAYSTNGGINWTTITAAGGPGAQWDPGLIVDKHGVIHLHFHELPADRSNAKIKYGKTANLGATPMTFKEISEPGVRSLLTIFCYDYVRDVQWIFWKDERDYAGTNDPRSDAACKYSSNQGETWSALEFLTDLGDTELGFKKCAVGNDGIVHFTYEFPPTGIGTIYYKRRLGVPTSVQNDLLTTPSTYVLEQNYPNPFNPSTTISFLLPQREHVTLKVFDVNGREVATLVEGEMNAGAHHVAFDAPGLPSGVYFYQIKTVSFTKTRKAVLVR